MYSTVKRSEASRVGRKSNIKADLQKKTGAALICDGKQKTDGGPKLPLEENKKVASYLQVFFYKGENKHLLFFIIFLSFFPMTSNFPSAHLLSRTSLPLIFNISFSQ